MASTREMRLRIKSVKNLAQVTKALETVSASKVKKAVEANNATRSYSEKAWKVLVHLACQPGSKSLHPLLAVRKKVRKTLVVIITSDRGLAGAYNVNIVRQTLQHFQDYETPVVYVVVGRKGRELLVRQRATIIADYADLPVPTSFMDVSSIGKLVVDDYRSEKVDEVYLAYTEYVNTLTQEPVIRKLLPLIVESVDGGSSPANQKASSVFSYEPGQTEILSEIVPRFTALQVYQVLLASQASENASRMNAMRNASDNARDLVQALEMDYNKIRQQVITSDMLDIVGGAVAQEDHHAANGIQGEDDPVGGRHYGTSNR